MLACASVSQSDKRDLVVISSLWLRWRLQEFLVGESEGAESPPTPSLLLGSSRNGELSPPPQRWVVFIESMARAETQEVGSRGAAESSVFGTSLHPARSRGSFPKPQFPTLYSGDGP